MKDILGRLFVNITDEMQTCLDYFNQNWFRQAFPCLFPYGTGDRTLPRRGKDPSILAWIRHLTRLSIPGEPVNRFASDYKFVHCVTDMYIRCVWVLSKN